MGNNFDAGWGEWCFVEVKVAVDLGVGRELGVHSRCAKEIKSDAALWNEFIPEADWEVGVGAAEAGNQMVFEGSDAAFGGVASMCVWGHQLKVDALGLEILLEFF